MLNDIVVAHRSRELALVRRYGREAVYDLTSRGKTPWCRFSPFWPWGDIPVPCWPGKLGGSVEGIWQGLKRFENEDEISVAVIETRRLTGIKRTTRGRGRRGIPRGRVVGHQRGCGNELLDYYQARLAIYLPAYRWVLTRKLGREVSLLRARAQKGPLWFLDYEINCDCGNLETPLSHAGLVKLFICGEWPEGPGELEAE